MVSVITLNKGVHMLNEKERSDLTKITLLIAKGIGKSRRAKFNLNYDPNTSSLFEANDYYKNYST